MYSLCDTPKGGFPHSEISGSKLICQLPEAYRRLSRPSSPVIAKASTTCTYSLDPITLTPGRTGIVKEFTEFTRSPFFWPSWAVELHLTQSSCRWPTPVDSDFRLYELLKNDSRLLESLA